MTHLTELHHRVREQARFAAHLADHLTQDHLRAVLPEADRDSLELLALQMVAGAAYLEEHLDGLTTTG